MKRHGLWIGKTTEKSSRYHSSKEPPLQTQKVEVYSSTFKQYNYSPLPEYHPIAFHKKKGEFILTTFKSNLWSKGTANSKWAKEIFHENRLWINRKAAQKLGIKNGNRVRVISPVGTLIVRALITNRIHPNSVALAEGLGHTATGNVARAKRFKSKDQDTNLIWWNKKGNGVNPNEIIERRADPIGGGPCLKDTKVRVEKL